ncbi:hypothetical protein BO94DRAFT_532079 [Aspergillus sclerotioniger CBS 115572]|uniref:Uncharacterized protein n=1 Tax=Aspergillus sclerotioniger CBS 115572 TaxID=1450535 RepID=A0A317X6A5_9EURO|nr:hypothetical protein BO94DRAFT_532079 [Aspergillus sclerotioniger CBS 115572]PWY94113.1 hypothetical protein BO94DRAFT_532079 [Aspergillus sclerotioniger CBS 115572]
MPAEANAPAPADMLAAFHQHLKSRSATGKPPRYSVLLRSPKVDLLLRSRLAYVVNGSPAWKTDLLRDPQTAAEEAVHAIEMNIAIFGVTIILFVWSDVLNGTNYAAALDPIAEEVFEILFDSTDVAFKIAKYGEGFADEIATFSANTNLTAAQRTAKIQGYLTDVRAHENDARTMLTRLTTKSDNFVAAWVAVGQESSRNVGQDLLDAEDLRIEFVANVGIQARTWNTTVVDSRMIESMLQMAITMVEYPSFMQTSLDRAVEHYTANALHMRAFADKLTEWLDENEIDRDILDS